MVQYQSVVGIKVVRISEVPVICSKEFCHINLNGSYNQFLIFSIKLLGYRSKENTSTSSMCFMFHEGYCSNGKIENSNVELKIYHNVQVAFIFKPRGL